MKRFLMIIASLLILVLGISLVVHAQVQVVTTFSILADLVSEVGGDKVEVHSIVPFGGDPHSFEPTPREARHVASADVLFSNGMGLELWLDRLIDNAGRKNLKKLVLSQGLATIEADHSHHEHEHGHELGDPHLWLDVQYVIIYVKRITAALVEIDPVNTDYYQQRSARYLAELEELDQWFLAQVALIPVANRKIITYHNAFNYLANRYGLEVEAFLVVNTDREPSSREMVEVTKLMMSHPKRVVFTEPQVNTGQRYMDAIAKEVGGRVYVLYSGSLTADVPTYIEMMRHNGTILLEALQ